jgi:acetolactate decarboxylase
MSFRNLLKPVTSLALLFPALTCAAKPVRVNVVGEVKKVLHEGDIQGRITLGEIAPEHLYALGVAEKLDGDITVIDGKSVIAKAGRRGEIHISHATSLKAPLLIYATVAAWREIKIPARVKSRAGLEAFVASQLKRAERKVIVPFLLKAKFTKIRFNIARPVSERSFRRRRQNLARFVLNDVEGQVVGFYSSRQQGIVSHMDSFLHAHFVSNDEKASGHVYNFKLGEDGGTLFLPD